MFHDWENFYLLIGSASGALIGLLFVVVTLTAGQDRSETERGARLYVTPTVLHFALVLTVSAIATAPDLPLAATSVGIAGCAALGAIYMTSISIQLHRGNTPEIAHWSDFWFYGTLPAAAYVALAATAASVWITSSLTAYGIGFVLLGLLLIGIRNAWDLVTFLSPRAAKG